MLYGRNANLSWFHIHVICWLMPREAVNIKRSYLLISIHYVHLLLTGERYRQTMTKKGRMNAGDGKLRQTITEDTRE